MSEHPTLEVLSVAGPPSVRRLVDAFLEGLSENTLRAYSTSLDDFHRFTGLSDVAAAAARLVKLPHGAANELALSYRAHLIKRGLSAGTVNARLAALRSLVKCARTIGVIPWSLEVPRLPPQPYRDTRGPGREGFVAMMKELGGRDDAKAVRDRAILRLLYERALRCNEVRTLDVCDVDLQRGLVKVLGKGRREREAITLASSTVAAIAAWLEVRGTAPGPLFVRVHVARGGPGRLTRQGIYRLVRKLGESVDVRARPHGLRHAAITAALDAGADVRAVQRFARHKSLVVTTIYDDNRADFGGAVANVIAVEQLDAPARRAPAKLVPLPPLEAGARGAETISPAAAAALRRGSQHHETNLTDDQVLALRRRSAAGEGPSELAGAYGISTEQVRSIVQRESWAHLPAEPGVVEPPDHFRRGEAAASSKLTAADVLAIRRRYPAGESGPELAAAFGVGDSTVRRIVKRETWCHVAPEPGVLSERQAPPPRTPRAKLSEADVLEVRRRRATGATYQVIADAFGVSQSAVHKLCTGSSWQHVGQVERGADEAAAKAYDTPRARLLARFGIRRLHVHNRP